MVKILLVRSPSELVKENLAGYGWPQVNFSEASTFSSLLTEFEKTGIDLGRQRNQIRRFYEIKKGDIIVVPLYGAIAIGYATGIKSYGRGVGYGENRVGVEYLRNADGSLVRIPRNELSEALSTRLRIRMSVVSLDEFRDEIIRQIDQIRSSGGASFDSHVESLESEALDKLRSRMLSNIRKGKTNLQSGGIGLENLVAELLSLEGYSSKIYAKNAFEGNADADVGAFKEDRFSSTKLIIQVKHHDGTTGELAIQQLAALDQDEYAQRWLITTGDIGPRVLDLAEREGVRIMDGLQFVEWLLEHAGNLSPKSKNRLGISELPMLLL